MKKTSKTAALALAMLFGLSALAGCGGGTSSSAVAS